MTLIIRLAIVYRALLIALVVVASFATFDYALALDCYDTFVFHWHMLNPVLECLNDTAGGGESNTASNVGSFGSGVFAQKVLVDLQFKKLLALNGIEITSNSTNVMFNATGSGEATVCSNLGSVGEGIYVSGNCNFKKLLAGTGISLSANGTRITITNTSPDDTSCANVGGGSNVYKDGECNFRSIIGTSPITATQNTNDVTIACSTCITSLDTTWVELERQSPADGGTTFTTDSFTAVKYLMITVFIKGDATVVTGNDIGMRFNGDTGSNYGQRESLNGGAQATSSALSNLDVMGLSFDETNIVYQTCYITNLSANNKLVTCNASMHTDASTGSPESYESWGVWRNTASQITSITVFREGGTYTFDASSEIVVYGRN